MLSEKGIPFEVTDIDLKNKPDWFLKISPYGLVPVVTHGDNLIYESAVINEYLEEVFPETPMLADDPMGRATMRIWIDFCNTRLHARQAAILKAEPEEFQEKTKAYEDSLTMVEEHLEKIGGPDPFYGGARFTLVDATYAPLFERSRVLPQLRGYDIPESCERVRRWRDALAAHPAVEGNSTPLEELTANYISWLPESVRKQVA